MATWWVLMRHRCPRVEVVVAGLLAGVMIAAGLPANGHAAGARPRGEILRAGAASLALDVPAGTPLAGYGALPRRPWLPDVFGRVPYAFWFKPSTGVLDPVMARALVVSTPSSRLLWLTADLIAVDRDFTDEVSRRVAGAGMAPATLIISASHTHSGPGAFLDSALMGFLAVDRQDPGVRRALVGSLVEAVRRADASAVEARAGAFSVQAPPVVSSRLRQPVDNEIVGLGFTTPAGRPIAVVWNYAVRGTMLGPRNLRLSPDVMGVASRAIEQRLGAPALFVNGAMGDVSPARHGEQTAKDVGAELAATVSRGWEDRVPIDRPGLATATTRLALGSPGLSVRNCVASWVPRAVRLPLGRVFPREAELLAVAIGDVAWVTVPGELQARLGLEIKRSARGTWRRVFIAGTSNDYLGYFVTGPDYDWGHYASCTSVYGRGGGDRIAKTARKLLGQLAGSRPKTE